MFPDFQDLIALLNKHKAKYLIVGGYAGARHAQPRATKDLDILIQPAPRNAAAVYAALLEFGAPCMFGPERMMIRGLPRDSLPPKTSPVREPGTPWVCHPSPSTSCRKFPA